MVSTQTPLEAAIFQGEPDWLREKRQRAFEMYTRLPMPSRTDEEWRRTDIAGLDPSAFLQFETYGDSDMGGGHDGVILEALTTEAATNHRDLLEPRLFSLARPERDRIAALHSALFTGGSFLYVPDGVVIDEPIIGRHRSRDRASLPHTVIVAGRGSKFNYLDEYIDEAGAEESYRTGSAEIFVGEGAEVGYV